MCLKSPPPSFQQDQAWASPARANECTSSRLWKEGTWNLERVTGPLPQGLQGSHYETNLAISPIHLAPLITRPLMPFEVTISSIPFPSGLRQSRLLQRLISSHKVSFLFRLFVSSGQSRRPSAQPATMVKIVVQHQHQLYRRRRCLGFD